MELVSRMMDGSIPYQPKDAPEGPIAVSGKVSQDQKSSYLQRVPILADCTKAQLRTISRITDVLETPVGEVLARAGEPGDTFFFIVDGTARIELPPHSPRQLGPGEFFGEMSLLDGQPRSATVIAGTPMRLLVIHRRDFWNVLKEVPALSQRILVTLSRRVREAELLLGAERVTE